MPRPCSHSAALRTAPLLAALALAPAAAPAREPAPDIQQFKPVTDAQGFALVHDATLQRQWRPAFGLYLNYAVNPLEVNAAGYGRQFGIVDGIFGGDLVAALGIFDWWEVGLHFPFMQVPVETPFIETAGVGGRALDYGIGDLRVETRLRILDPAKKPIGLAGNLFLTLPTGSTSAGLGRGLPGGGFRAIVSQRWRRFHFAANLGWAFWPRATVANLSTGDEFTYAVGVGVSPIVDRLDINLELDGSLTPGPNDRDGVERSFDGPHSPMELLLGAQYRMKNGLGFGGGIGKGLSPGFGSPDFRVWGTVSWGIFRPFDRDKDGLADPDDPCRKEPEDKDGFQDDDGCPDPDNDADGFRDVEEDCPDQAEDGDGFQDDDGCPDPDNDQDGVADQLDNCPMEPEDKDGFQDDDGCLDPDNDGDGILDAADRCANQAETVDGWADEDGCPDPDNDGDGLLDEVDLCPGQAEEKNGVRDQDGCPDATRAAEKGDQIVLLDPIEFQGGTAKIAAASLPVVDAVAKLMRDNPRIAQVRVEAHTDNKGKEAELLKLSQSRAEAVMRRLIEQKVDATRLQAAGYGQSRPLASNRTDEGRARNRRIELKIVVSAPALAPASMPAGPALAPANPWGAPASPAPNPWGN